MPRFVDACTVWVAPGAFWAGSVEVPVVLLEWQLTQRTVSPVVKFHSL